MASYRLTNKCDTIKNNLQSCNLNNTKLYNTNRTISISHATKEKYDILEFDTVSSKLVPPNNINNQNALVLANVKFPIKFKSEQDDFRLTCGEDSAHENLELYTYMLDAISAFDNILTESDIKTNITIENNTVTVKTLISIFYRRSNYNDYYKYFSHEDSNKNDHPDRFDTILAQTAFEDLRRNCKKFNDFVS